MQTLGEPAEMELLLSTTLSAVSTVNEDQPDNWKRVTDDVRIVFIVVNRVVITGTVCLFGISTNVVNIIVFCKQDLTNTVNISLLGLAVSDFCSLVTLGWTSVCLNPLLRPESLPFVAADVEYLTSGGPHAIFANITCWITVYITAERCLCIALPLKVKQILTPLKTKLIVCCLYVVMILASIPEYASVYLGWRFYPELNKTLIGLTVSESRHELRGFVFILGAALGITSFFLVVILTLLLAINLQEKSKWRKSVTLLSSKADVTSSRDKKTVRMVVLIASFLIMCFAPSVTLKLAVFCEPDFSLYGRYSNLFHVSWSFAFLFEAVNASTSIFFYYTMSSRYRQIILQCFQKFHALT